MLGNVGKSMECQLACSADWLSKEFCELSTDLGRSKAKAWKNSSIHLYAPPVTTVSMEGPSFRRWGTKKSVCSSPWTPKEAHAQGRSGLTTEFWRHIWQSDFKSHVHQCFEWPMFWSSIMPIYPYIYIYMWLYPDPPSNFALGLLSHLQKVCPKFYEKKLEGLGAHLDLFSKAPNQFLPDLMAVEDRCMLCRPQISSGSRLLDTWRIFAIRYCNLMKGDHLIFNWNPMTHIQ